MRVVYASRTGNVEKVVNLLRVENPLKLLDGTETVDEDFLLITFTDGKGALPCYVKAFMDANASHCKGVACSGNSERHAATFAGAADQAAELYGVPIVDKFDLYEADLPVIWEFLKKG